MNRAKLVPNGPVNQPPIPVGTSSFTASGWNGSFYPGGTKPSDYLAFYADRLYTVGTVANASKVPLTRSIRHGDALRRSNKKLPDYAGQFLVKGLCRIIGIRDTGSVTTANVDKHYARAINQILVMKRPQQKYALATMQPAPMPLPILFIAREPLVAGREDAYREIEEETARESATLGCPHPYLAMESLTGLKKIWWFNGFDSPEEQTKVCEAYSKNAPFSAMLKKQSDRKAPVTGKVIETVARYRPDLTSGVPWMLGHARFLVIAVAKDRPSSAGTVYEAGDETFLVFSPVRTRKQADRLVATIPDATIAVVRPSFSFPAKDWVTDDPRFWRAETDRHLTG